MSLVEQRHLEAGLPENSSWHADCYRQLAARLTPPSDFPCIFSQNAFGRGLLLFSFIEDTSQASLEKAASDLSSYVQLSRDWDGKVSTARPLVVAFSRNAARADSVAGYHAIGWRTLQAWHEIDTSPWPDDVATDPHSPFWALCYDGMQLFVNMSNPAHVRRRSRNLGDYLLFIVNPRERFDIVAGETPEGRRVRQRIRDRIEVYDGIGHSEQLGSYNAGDIEWWQYGIIEENRERLDRCPFIFRGH